MGQPIKGKISFPIGPGEEHETYLPRRNRAHRKGRGV